MSAWNTPPRPQDIPHRTTLHRMVETVQTVRTMIVDLEVLAADLGPTSTHIDRRVDSLRSSLIELRDELAREERYRQANR